MLGRKLHDPHGIEGKPGSSDGLGWLDCETTLEQEKQLRNVAGTLALGDAVAMRGYEIHMGITLGPAISRPAISLSDGHSDGAISPDNQILASYCHGLFDHPEALAALLQWAGLEASRTVDFAARREQDIERLADAVETAIDWEKLHLLRS